jgi:hypothetical protein
LDIAREELAVRLNIILVGLAIFFISGYFFWLCYTDYQQLSSSAGLLARAMRPSLNDYYRQITLYTYISGSVALAGLCLAFAGAVSKAEPKAIQPPAPILPSPPPLPRVKDTKVSKQRRRKIAIAAVTVAAVALALILIPFIPVEATFNDSQPYSLAVKPYKGKEK